MDRAKLSMATMNPDPDPDPDPDPADANTIATAISWLARDEAVDANGATLLDGGDWASACGFRAEAAAGLSLGALPSAS